MSIIEITYASAPSDEVIIPALEILIPSYDPIRIVGAYKDYELTDENSVTNTFLAASFDYKEPAKNTSGQQNLSFSISNVTGDAQRAVDFAISQNVKTEVIWRCYVSTDLTAPAKQPYKMTLRGGQFQGGNVQIDAGYFDPLNYAWPRNRYTNDFAPGLRYIR
jgi:hypothetical protein